MPLEIVRNDITRVKADAIINTANPDVAVGRGTDYSIYKAAGFEKLLEARNMIGKIVPGHTAVTPAFDLDARYVIHTVGPEWIDGSHGEKETVASCYRNCLSEAARLGCESVAFPLISTGTYGFPKDAALDIAIREIADFLDDHEMNVSLVVYDKESFALSSQLFEDVKSYIEDSELDQSVEVKMPARSGRRKLFGRLRRRPSGPSKPIERLAESGCVPMPEELQESEPMAPQASEAAGELEPMASQAYEAADETERSTGALYSKRYIDAALADLLKARDESFQQKLFRLIDARGMSDPEVYKKANIDRKLFSKIRSNPEYKPTKKTAVAFAIALGLNLDETTDLLQSAGLSLSPSSSFDIIIRYCIEHRIMSIHEVNCILFEFDQMLLGA